MNVTPGTRLACIVARFGKVNSVRFARVERVTPTGIVVLDNGTRLNPHGDHWQVRGGSYGSWDGPDRWVFDNDPQVITAVATVQRQNQQSRIQSLMDRWKKEPDAELTDQLISALGDWSRDAPTP